MVEFYYFKSGLDFLDFKSEILVKASGGKLSPTSSLYIGKSQFNKKVVIDLEYWCIVHCGSGNGIVYFSEFSRKK